MVATVSETLNKFVCAGGDARTSSGILSAVHLTRFYTYAFRVDTSPPPAGEALPDDVAWTHDPSGGGNQYPEHCGKHGGNPLDYRRRIGHTSERAATEWSSVYTSGAGFLYSRGTLIATRQAIGGRDGQIAVMIRSIVGLDTVQRRHVAQLRKEISNRRALPHAWANNVIVLTVKQDVLTDHELGPRWACTILRQDGTRETATVHAFNRDRAWDVLRTVCVTMMDDGVLRCPDSVALRPTSATVDVLSKYVPEVVHG